MTNLRMQLQGFGGRAIQGSALDMPFPDESLDFVFSIGCFHHTGNVQRCLDETYRVLRPGGTAVLMVYNKFSLRQWTRWPFFTFKELLREWRQTCAQMGIPYTDEDAAAFAAEAYPLNRLSDERLAQAEAKVPKSLADALVDLFWRAVPYGETEDGDVLHYLFTKGTVHRLIGQAQSAGVPAVFRSDGSEHMPDTDERATLAEGWGFGLEAAAALVAATSWPWERREDRDEWSVRLISEPDLLAREAKQARVRLESAIAALSGDAAPRTDGDTR